MLQGEAPKRIYRLYQERGLAWAIPTPERGLRRGQGWSVLRAYFDPSRRKFPALWFKFDVEGKELQRITPLGFATASGFSVDVTKTPTLGGQMEFELQLGSIASVDHDLMGNQILPFDEVAEVAAIRETSRRFVATVTAHGEKYALMSFQIPFREVRAPKDGKVYLAQENALRAALTTLAASGNRQPRGLDLSRIPATLHEQARTLAAAMPAGAFDEAVEPTPTVNVGIYAFAEKELELADGAKFEAAATRYGLVAHFVKPWSYTTVHEEHQWKFSGRFGGIEEELATVPLRAYLAGHFLVNYGVEDAPVTFATFLRLGMVHSDRMHDCAVELGKHSNVKPPNG